MPHQDPAIPPEEPTVDDGPAQDTAIQAQQQAPGHEPAAYEPVAETDTAVQATQRTPAYEPPAYEPVAEEDIEEGDEWLQEPDELPHRPRRRLLGAGGNGAGGNPIFLALLGVLLIACGFIGGVLIEKGQTSSSSTSGAGASGLASRFAALRGGASGAGASGAGSSTTGSSGAGAAGAGFTRPTTGTLAYLAGSTLYVTNSEGNTVKVNTSAGTTVTKSVKSTVKGIHPGETVTITGATGSAGAVSAESISVGSTGGGLTSLFGGAGAGDHSGSAAGGSSSSSEPALFGKGG